MPTVYLKKDSGGKVLLVGGAVATGVGCCCGEFCPYQVIVSSVTISGAVPSGEECGGGDVALSGTVEGDPCAANETGDPCSCLCSALLPIVYECEFDCPNPEKVLQIDVAIGQPDCPNGDWVMDIDASYSAGNTIYCGNGGSSLGGSILTDENLGPDPTGTHVLSFDDPGEPSVHWDITVTVS
jgi:hypothetical protein